MTAIPLPVLTELAAVHGAEIVRAQTTFADVRIGQGAFRITYSSKKETSLVPGRVGDLRFEREHELLIEYREARGEHLLAEGGARTQLRPCAAPACGDVMALIAGRSFVVARNFHATEDP